MYSQQLKSSEMPCCFGGSPKCKRCNKSVYAAEMVTALDSKWHKMCFKCEECDKMLESGKENEHDSKLYCQNCHGKMFGPKGVGVWATVGCLSTEEELKQACQFTKDSIRRYSESPKAVTKVTATNPNRLSVSEEKPSHSHCTQEKIHQILPIIFEPEQCVTCRETIDHAADKMIVNHKIYHKMCVKCVKCEHVLEDGSVLKLGEALYCLECYNIDMYAPTAQRPSLYSYSHTEGTPGRRRTSLAAPSPIRKASFQFNDKTKRKVSKPPNFGKAPKCRKCDESVYAAEMVTALDSKWHKMCFKCEGCDKILESGKEAEYDDKPYCKSCHDKKFGRTVGTMYTAGSLSNAEELKKDKDSKYKNYNTTTKVIPISDIEKCVRCGDTVYAAEKMTAINKIYHKRCIKCATCDKCLDAGSVLEHGDEMYCLMCYNKDFAPKGLMRRGTHHESR